MEQSWAKYPIGIQTFEEIIKGGYSYVDKTELVYNLVKGGKYYFISRPRRFGKSLLITTLQAYFEGKKDLFKGLYIADKETDWEKYPVFHLDFSGATYSSVEIVKNRLESYFATWENIYGKNPVEVGYDNRLPGLMKRAYEKTGKKCVILIDEYDKPLTDAIGNVDLQNQNRAILQGLYGVLKNADANIKFAMLTGVTRYGKLGIFSAANNPKDISLSNAYSTICGVTEEEMRTHFDDEIDVFSRELHLSKECLYDLLKVKYDGYHFSEKTVDIYNPFSLFNSLSDHQIGHYWFATGTPTYLTLILKKVNFDLSKLDGEIYASEEELSSFGNGEDNLIAALYQSGYLTIKGYEDGLYTLGIPNEEVAKGLTSYLIPEFFGSPVSTFAPEIKRLSRAILNGDANGVMEQLQALMEDVPFENNEPKMLEIHFRNMVYLMVRFTGHKTHIELPKLGGRIDICFETDKFAYIIECKRDLSAKKALEQININKYAQRISWTDKRLFKIGANFSTEQKNLTEWVVE